MTDSWFFEVLPCRPAPLPGECLSGYLLRLAEANGFPQLWDLASDLFPRWSSPSQTRRLRWDYPVEDWQCLQRRTQLASNRLQALTLAPLVEKFRPLPNWVRSSHLSPSLALRGVVTPDLQVCPLCLQAEPYLRLIWRLAGISTCLEHACLLQTHCAGCGTRLSVANPEQRHLHCAMCEADLRHLPVTPTPAAILTTQRAREIGLRFLLDPDQRLVPALPPGSAELPQRVGLKFRYLRLQEKWSLAKVAREMGIKQTMLSALERGARAPLALYLAYLERFRLSWAEFAGLAIPAEFVEELSRPRHLPLRLCPTVSCPNHQPHPKPRVILLADLPERRVARFLCQTCGCRFTRSYAGHLTAKPRKPVIQRGDPPTVPKPPHEIAHLKTMGLRGEDNRQIAQALGWGEKTVRMYWIALGLEEQVHQAQARRRAHEQQQRHAARRAQVEAVLRTMGQQDEEITLRRVGLALEHGPDYLNTYPDLARRVKAVAETHNAQLRQRRYAAVQVCLSQAIEQMQQSHTIVKVEALVRPTGLTYLQLEESFPDLYALAQQATRSHREALRATRRQARQAAINAAAARLVARGSRLTYGSILKEAKLSKYTAQCDSTLRDLLQQWVGGFAPHD